ncbi:MAG TPA: hypothetical protein DCQ26_01005 [Marinilabiliales bacterium]|jgi:hypothetical protein|nr:MAG: hypothetical protein A2W95_13035 [Bacteroidetes bacterium GWA2_40_14]OFX59127.1 MAG: hypothetical protein A2W84_18045 [Bacteroidetes bacterium GWC2_40_13]OFX74839.1 MAG: hypothetical protein A2W96_01770 [Bacteroidetes bacterium GWD2_40_43]OFX93382.1 MAG: hypothetical protein A2W97_15100 [Bacteroidetes bacterium GWE2_40_63]OFY18395.1 MAG: hypothetical protein A2W88_19020 [Bacteroidetes bacterium GWF2_40_13]OFZ30773.1 MAG: hypothetical protein A2437_11320 [Bacteroidetes bacterium RIFOXYC
MKQKDYLLITFITLGLLLFIWFEGSRQWYLDFNSQHGMITSFFKFGILATFGEMLGLRIRKGIYYEPAFGVFPKFIVWGFLGLTIKMAFVVFASGTPIFMEYMGIADASASMKAAFTAKKLAVAFAISVAMNVIYAPVMMTFHKITDSHIQSHQGQWVSLLKPIRFAADFQGINWNIQWHFVFKKTIPFFWIPAHTITFLLPADFQVLFAALLSVMLGLILAIASLKSKN